MTELCLKINDYINKINRILPSVISNNQDTDTIINTILNVLSLNEQENRSALLNIRNYESICSNSNVTSQSNISDYSECQTILDSIYKAKLENNYLNYLNTLCTYNDNIQIDNNTINKSCIINSILNSLNLNTFDPVIFAIYYTLNNYLNGTAPFRSSNTSGVSLPSGTNINNKINIDTQKFYMKSLTTYNNYQNKNKIINLIVGILVSICIIIVIIYLKDLINKYKNIIYNVYK